MADCEISFDPLRIDFVSAAALLSQTYWGKGRTEGDQLRAFANSLCAGAFHEGLQIGFARIVTDRAFFAYICDMIVWPDHRDQGIGTQLARACVDHPELAGVVHWSLYTNNAHSVYAKLGFERSGDGNYMRLERRGGA